MKGALYNEYILCVVAAQAHRPAGEMDRRTQRRPSVRRALPRQHHRGRARARQGRQSSSACASKRLPISAPTTTPTAAAGPPTVNIGVLAGTYVLPAAHVEVDRRSDQHHADRPLSRRRPAGSRLRDRDHGRPRRARARHRSGRAAPAQHHSGRARCRTRPRWSTPTTAAISARTSRTAWSRPTTRAFAARYRGFGAARQTARHRHFQHGRSVECRPDRARGNALRSDRHGHRRWSARMTTARATRPRSARSSPTSSASIPTSVGVQMGRHRPDRDRHRHIRLALDCVAAAPRSLTAAQKDRRQGHQDRRAPDGSRRARHRVRGRQVHRRRHRQIRRHPELARDSFIPAKIPKGMEPGLFEIRHVRRRPAHLSRTAATSARSRSTRRPARSSLCAIRRSTTSAT